MKDRFYELQGELNQIQSTRSWLDSKGKLIVAELDELERQMQEAHKAEELAELEQEILLARIECANGGCPDD